MAALLVLQLLLNHLIGFAPSITSLLINLPLLLFSLFIFGKRSIFYGQLLVLLLWFSFRVHGRSSYTFCGAESFGE